MRRKREKNRRGGAASPALTVAVACGGNPEALAENLKALSRQLLDSSLWTLILLARQRRGASARLPAFPKELKASRRILFLLAGRPAYELRNLAIEQAKTPLLYFIDEDVILTSPGRLEAVCRLHKEHPEAVFIGGAYLDHPGCSFWGRAYNYMTELWMRAHPGYLPAGNLSVKTSRLQGRFYSPAPGGFGGEEAWLLERALQAGLLSLKKPELAAPHRARHSFRDLCSRAWSHGCSLAIQKRAGARRPGAPLFHLLLKAPPRPLLVKAAAFCYLALVQAIALAFGCRLFLFRRDRANRAPDRADKK